MLFIERFTESKALCEDENGVCREVERALIPTNAAEGDILILSSDGSWKIDRAATEKRRHDMLLRLEKLSRK